MLQSSFSDIEQKRRIFRKRIQPMCIGISIISLVICGLSIWPMNIYIPSIIGACVVMIFTLSYRNIKYFLQINITEFESSYAFLTGVLPLVIVVWTLSVIVCFLGFPNNFLQSFLPKWSVSLLFLIVLTFTGILVGFFNVYLPWKKVKGQVLKLRQSSYISESYNRAREAFYMFIGIDIPDWKLLPGKSQTAGIIRKLGPILEYSAINEYQQSIKPDSSTDTINRVITFTMPILSFVVGVAKLILDLLSKVHH